MFAWITDNPIVYPAFEVGHIMGIGLLLGSLVLLELRIWGFGTEIPVAPLARLALAITLCGFGLAVMTGSLMFASHPLELLTNRAFVLKMGLLMLAGTNAALFHARGGLARLDRIARWQTATSVCLWITVLACGRWIAYR